MFRCCSLETSHSRLLPLCKALKKKKLTTFHLLFPLPLEFVHLSTLQKAQSQGENYTEEIPQLSSIFKCLPLKTLTGALPGN